MTRVHANRGRAFTLIETMLAMVVGGLVLLGCVSVFLASARSERAWSQRYERSGEMWTTQLAVRRTFLNLLVNASSAESPAADAVESATPTERPRVVLQPDPGAPLGPEGWRPQRMEVTVGQSPMPAIVGSQIGSWLVEQDRAASLDFASEEISSGAIRGVFELRPSGTREVILMGLGVMDPDPGLIKRMQTDPPRGWTLWWRPILSAELAELNAGFDPRGDLAGTNDETLARLAGAVPVLRGVDALRWQVFKGDTRVDEYAGTSLADLPAFVELEVRLVDGRYANWMFEIGWTTGEDPTTGDTTTGTEDEEGTAIVGGGGANGNGGGAGGGSGSGAGSGRPGGRPTRPVAPPGSDVIHDASGGQRPRGSDN